MDEQEAGPYAIWRHTHDFERIPSGTRIHDRVEYALPLGPLGRLAHAGIVRRLLERIFDVRREAIERAHGASQSTEGSNGAEPRDRSS